MTPSRTAPTTATARRRAIAHRAAEGTVTAYLRDLSAPARRERAGLRPRHGMVVPPATARPS